jgi:hypothetical protein
MTRTIQINPEAPALSVSRAFGAWLHACAEDFALKYCFVEPSAKVITALRAIAPESPDEQRAITTIVSLLEAGETVELLYGY